MLGIKLKTVIIFLYILLVWVSEIMLQQVGQRMQTHEYWILIKLFA